MRRSVCKAPLRRIKRVKICNEPVSSPDGAMRSRNRHESLLTVDRSLPSLPEVQMKWGAMVCNNFIAS